MDIQKQHSALKKWSIRLLWVCLGLFVLGLVLRLSLKTGFVHNQARSYIVKTANNQLNAELSIDRLSGDLWKEVTLSGIALQQQDTLARIDSIHTAYNLWAFIDGKIDVSELRIYQPKINLEKKEGRWNTEDLIPESSDTTQSETVMMPFQVGNFVLERGVITVQSDSLPVGSVFSINELQLASSLGYQNDEYSINLNELSFKAQNDVSLHPVNIETAASFEQQQFSLEQLVIAAGESVVRASGNANAADSALQFDLFADPITWQDAADYIEAYPLREDINMNLSLSGKPEQFEVLLSASGNGLGDMRLQSQFSWQEDLIIQQLTATSEQLDLKRLLADTTYPRINNLDARFEGAISVADYQKSKGDFSLSMSEIFADPYRLDRFAAKGSLDEDSAALTAQVSREQQLVEANISAKKIWDELPSMRGTISGTSINPGYWVQDTTLSGDLAFQAEFTGKGWYPQKESWQYGLRMERGTMMGHPITDLDLRGQLSAEDVTADGQLGIREGVVELASEIQQFSGDPSYTYNLRAQNIDLGPLVGQQDFPTALSGTISGQGRGFDPAEMQLETSVAMDSSIVNGELIRKLSADLAVEKGVAQVDSAQLRGAIADGAFSLQMNLLDYYDLENELFLDLDVKDISALAPLANADTLTTEGNIRGTLRPIENEELHFLGNLDLSDVVYNSLFTTDHVEGSIDIHLSERLGFHTDVALQQPAFSGIPLQNLEIATKGNYYKGITKGQFDFQISSATEGRIEQAGSYAIAEDSVHIQTDEFNIITDYRILSLEQPFGFRYQNESIQLDTMRVSSGDGSFLEMGLPMLSETEQNGFVKGQSLNTAVIQSSLFGEKFFTGMLSGEFEIAREDTNLNARGEMLLSELTVDEAEFDSLLITTQIEDERLKGDLLLRDDGTELAVGDADLPFKLGDPEQFDESFFRESVSGDLRMQDIPVERFQSLFDPDEVTQTSGDFSFWGTLSGTAGDPEFDVDLSLKDAMLSGVAIDSVVAGGNYRHTEEELTLDASVQSLGQRAAQITGRFPFFIDMKTFEVNLPQKDDNIDVDVRTNDFDLKALNDFVDPLLVREVNGGLDGKMSVKGTVGDPHPDGHFELKGGAFRLVPAGIKVDKIATLLDFEPDHIQLSKFSAQSGGNLNASGKVGLDKLVPGNLDIKINGENFRAANTNQYNAVINTKSRVRGTVTNPNITGSLDFLSGFLKLDNFGEKSVENVRLDSLEEEGPSISLYDSLALDMDIGFNERFFIQNERYLDMEVELKGELDLSKKVEEDLQLFGSMNAASGFARPFGKEFDIEEGVVEFSGNPENPKLMIQTRYEPPQTQEDIVIWYIIEGTVEDPKFRYESEPPMELENIISYTLFGQPFYALDSWKQVVASSGSNTTAADVALDVLLDRVEALATQRLGIDVVKIDNTRSGGEAGTSITTGWYLNPKVFFAIQNVITGSTPDTGFLLEYMLREDLKLILRQGNNIRQGVDLRWNYDY